MLPTQVTTVDVQPVIRSRCDRLARDGNFGLATFFFFFWKEPNMAGCLLDPDLSHLCLAELESSNVK